MVQFCRFITLVQLKELLRKKYVPLTTYQLLEKDVTTLERRVSKLSRSLKSMQSVQQRVTDELTYNEYTMAQLSNMIADCYEAVKAILLALFSE